MGTYTNPKSKVRSRKEYNKRAEGRSYQNKHDSASSTNKNKRISYKDKGSTRKARIDKNGNVIDTATGKKVATKKEYDGYTKTTSYTSVKTIDPKVYNKKPEEKAKVFVTSDSFKDICIEMPVNMNIFHTLSNQSQKLIENFFEANAWSLSLLSKCLNKSYRVDYSGKYDYQAICKWLSHNKKQFHKKGLCNNDASDSPKANNGIFFYKTKHPVTKKVQWFFVINLSDAYDEFAENYKLIKGTIPYSILINHVIYNGISPDVDPDAKYSFNSRLAITLATSGAKYPIIGNHSVKYVLYNNDKNKRKALDKHFETYESGHFDKIVIKEIPINTKR